MENAPLRLGIMGGMFDPVHAGHFNAARQARESCRLDKLLLMPCGVPVHRAASNTGSGHRLAMLHLVANEKPWLGVDARECECSGVSRTWDSVEGIRLEYPGSLLFLVIGMDSLLTFPTWYRWQQLLDIVNLVVVGRPGYSLELLVPGSELHAQLQRRKVATETAGKLAEAGHIVILDERVIDVSSTTLREELSREQDAALQLHPSVQHYIEIHGLYRETE